MTRTNASRRIVRISFSQQKLDLILLAAPTSGFGPFAERQVEHSRSRSQGKGGARQREAAYSIRELNAIGKILQTSAGRAGRTRSRLGSKASTRMMRSGNRLISTVSPRRTLQGTVSRSDPDHTRTSLTHGHGLSRTLSDRCKCDFCRNLLPGRIYITNIRGSLPENVVHTAFEA